MNIIAIIPARMGSSRFHGKPLALIQNIPMLGHCYHRTNMCKNLLKTYVATCDNEIANYMRSISGNYIMTSLDHERASDRTAEALIKAEAELNLKIDIVVMVQGDEPMIQPEMISESLKPFKYKDVNVVNLMSKIKTLKEFNDPNEVKVVVDKFNNAIYFSREPIPTKKKGISNGPMLKQVCVIPFRRDYLIQFNKMKETELERIESVDMMRIIEHGEKVKMVMTDMMTYSVDTLGDLEHVEKLMVNDILIHKYI